MSRQRRLPDGNYMNLWNCCDCGEIVMFFSKKSRAQEGREALQEKRAPLCAKCAGEKSLPQTAIGAWVKVKIKGRA